MTLAALDFWLTSGWHLCDRDSEGHLLAGTDFMTAYFQQPELALVEESCPAERALHAKLTEQPFAAVTEDELSAMADPDIIDNYRAVLRFREFLGSHASLESAYMAIAGGAEISFPPLFVNQICHIIMRDILTHETEPMHLRAAEILFRSQSVTAEDGRIMVADETVVQMQADSQRLAGGQDRPEDVQIEILTRETQDAYWDRSDNFDTAIDIAFTQPGSDALARVLEKWVYHFLKIKVTVTPMQKIDDEEWSWHIGLDSDSSAILNALYHGQPVSEDQLKQILCLFRLEAKSGFSEQMKHKPVYLALSMNKAGVIQAKPQNLLANLPLANS